MISKYLERDILSFLNERAERSYTTTQISSYLGLKKEHRIDVQAVLNEMIAEGIVTKLGKRYSVVAKGAQSTQSQSTTSDSKRTSRVTKKKSQTYIGQFDATSLAKNYSYAYVICDEGKDILVSAEDTLNAYHGDTVEVRVVRYRNEKRYGIIDKVIKRHKERFVGVIESIKSKKYFRSDNLKIHTLFSIFDYTRVPDSSDKPIIIYGSEDGSLKVMVEVINWGLRQTNKLPMCKVVEVIGEAGVPDVEIMSVIREFDLPIEFPDVVIDEANMFLEELCDKEIKRRKDFRDLFTITIDPVSAKDFDDAISLIEADNGELHLYVHIADVAHYIKQGSELFKEAVNRGNSYYFPKKVIPMLPERLSNKLCSLRPDEDKYTITVLSVFSKNGDLQKQEIYESVIRSDVRLAYEEVDEYYEGRKKPKDWSHALYNSLDTMRKLSAQLSKTKYERGYLKFDLPEVEYIYDDEGYIENIVRSKETESHVVIENFMLIANEYVAKLLTKKAKETMYRIHEEPDEKDLHKITDMLRAYHINFSLDKDLNRTWQNLLDCLPDEKFHRVFDRLILRSMKKAKYSINHTPHFGLGLQTYTHFTSPIRRLCDLVIHMQLKDLVFKQSTTENRKQKTDNNIFKLAGIATEREVIADDAERMMENKIVTTFMKKRLGKQFKATIINLTSNSIFVELDDIPVRGVIKLNKLQGDYYEYDERRCLIKGRRKGTTFRLCDAIDVFVVSVSEEILFDVVGVYKKINKQWK